jgi:hypothetical protein
VERSGAALGDDSPETSRLRAVKPTIDQLRDPVPCEAPHIRCRLRATITLQGKRAPFLFRHLRSRGASIKAAGGAAFSGRGRLFCSNHRGLTRGYPPAWFSGKAVSLATRGTGSVHRHVAGRG